MLNSAIYCGRKCRFAVDFAHRLPEHQNRLPARTFRNSSTIFQTVVESRQEDKATKLPLLGSRFLKLPHKNNVIEEIFYDFQGPLSNNKHVKGIYRQLINNKLGDRYKCSVIISSMKKFLYIIVH